MRFKPRCRHLLPLLSVLLLVVFLTGRSPWPNLSSLPSEELLQHPFWNYLPDLQEPRDPQQTCIIPRVHPLHPCIWPFFKPTKPIVCKARQPWLTYVDAHGVLHVNSSAGYNPKHLRCSYQAVLRKTDNIVDLGPAVPFYNSTPITHGAISVSCRNFLGIPFYRNIHPVPVPAPAGGQKLIHPFNVLIFGIDSVSRLSMMRLLPRTFTYLTRELGSTVLRGMNKVGDNTFPNLIALLTGKEAYRQIKHPHGTNGTFDSIPLIWKEFKKLGYETFYAEDFPKFATFNYLAEGFREPPTDHYLRPFWLAVEQSYLIMTSSNLCFGNVAKYRIQMDYLRQLITRKPLKRPYFAFSFLVEISHDYMQQVAAADEDVLYFFTELYRGGFLDDTFLFFISDHGHRFDAIRETFVGRLEERLPFVAVRLPTNLRLQNVRANLNANAGRLTSPYDTYETLRDILATVSTGRPTGASGPGFGRSLFDSIPADRTCAQAGIPSQYCVCDVEERIDIQSPLAQRGAQAIVDKVNELLVQGLGAKAKLCSTLVLKKVREAHKVFSSDNTTSSANMNRKKLRIIVEVAPSSALLDGMLLVNDSGLVEVMDDISRINRYSNQSACIQHDILRKYCYCQ